MYVFISRKRLKLKVSTKSWFHIFSRPWEKRLFEKILDSGLSEPQTKDKQPANTLASLQNLVVILCYNVGGTQNYEIKSKKQQVYAILYKEVNCTVPSPLVRLPCRIVDANALPARLEWLQTDLNQVRTNF